MRYPVLAFDYAFAGRTLNILNLMLKWAILFAVISLIAGVLGFGGIAGASAGIAKILFFIFIAICVILFIAAMVVGKKIL